MAKVRNAGEIYGWVIKIPGFKNLQKFLMVWMFWIFNIDGFKLRFGEMPQIADCRELNLVGLESFAQADELRHLAEVVRRDHKKEIQTEMLPLSCSKLMDKFKIRHQVCKIAATANYFVGFFPRSINREAKTVDTSF